MATGGEWWLANGETSDGETGDGETGESDSRWQPRIEHFHEPYYGLNNGTKWSTYFGLLKLLKLLSVPNHPVKLEINLTVEKDQNKYFIWN